MELSLVDTLQSIGVILGLILSAGGVAKIFVTFQAEKKKSDMSIGGDVIDDNRNALEVSQLAIKQVLDLKVELATMQNEIAALRKEAEVAKIESADLRDWAARLVFQVKSLGGIPVDMKSGKFKT